LLRGRRDGAVREADQERLREVDRPQATMPLEEVWGHKVAACPRVDEEGGLHPIDGDLDGEQLVVEVWRRREGKDLGGVLRAVKEAVRWRGGRVLTGALEKVFLEAGARGAGDQVPAVRMRAALAADDWGRGAKGGEGGKGILKEVLFNIEELLGGHDGGRWGGRGQGARRGGGGQIGRAHV
jgi:hypothetical protein